MDKDKLWSEYNSASEKMKKLALGSGAAPLAMRRNVEQNYRIAYQNLVAAGLMPQIRGKYRGA